MKRDYEILDDRFEYRQSGNMQLRSELARVLSIAAFLSAAVLTVLSVVFWTWSMRIDFSDDNYLNLIAPVFLLIMTAIGSLVLWTVSILSIRRWLKGGLYHYEADGKGIKIEFKNRIDVIERADVVSVNFKKIKSFGLADAFHVVIKTVQGQTYKYCYVPPYKGIMNKPEDSPFYALTRKEKPMEDIGIIY